MGHSMFARDPASCKDSSPLAYVNAKEEGPGLARGRICSNAEDSGTAAAGSARMRLRISALRVCTKNG